MMRMLQFHSSYHFSGTKITRPVNVARTGSMAFPNFRMFAPYWVKRLSLRHDDWLAFGSLILETFAAPLSAEGVPLFASARLDPDLFHLLPGLLQSFSHE